MTKVATEIDGQTRGAAVAAAPRISGGTRFRHAAPWWIMVVPALVFLLVLGVYQVVQSVVMSFQQQEVGSQPVWVGWENYARLFSDPVAMESVGTTVVFALLATLLEVLLAWGLALLLWDLFARAGSVVRVLFAIPMMLSPVVVGVVWRVMLNPGNGWVPYLLGNKDLDLLGNPSTALWTMIVVDAWQWTPFLFIIFAASLTSIDEQVLEAARVDGASYWKLVANIVWPITLPTTIVGVMFRLIDELKIFDLPYNLTQGGPGTATQTFSIYTYKQAFVNFDQGYASTLAVLAAIASAIVAGILLILMRRAEARIG